MSKPNDVTWSVYNKLNRLLQYNWRNVERFAKIIDAEVRALVDQSGVEILRKSFEFALRQADIARMKAALEVAKYAAWLVHHGISDKKTIQTLEGLLEDIARGEIPTQKLKEIDGKIREKIEAFFEATDARVRAKIFLRWFEKDLCFNDKELCKEAEKKIKPLLEYIEFLDSKPRITHVDADKLAELWSEFAEWVRARNPWKYFDAGAKEDFKNIDAIFRRYLALRSTL